ncbi:MAG: S-layer homology domain-containing protein [Candidatus Margulisiibacteriota bacterium]|nr:S-layer homology domain-containing protein [Candidatus Margulisiibacteriota bacterium]
MKKCLVMFLAFALSMTMVMSASAQIKFKDVPSNHWAASAVYDLVKLGVTKGYPDGTFRGKNKITRYETAVFLSKLAKAIGASSNVTSDIAALKRDITALKRRPAGGGAGITGSYNANWMFGNLLAEAGGVRGAIADYRLKVSSSHNLGEGSDVTINLDTMDYGYMNDGATITGGVLTTELLDIESNLKLDLAALGLANPVDLKLTYGPGNKVHADPTGSFPSEIGVTYMRPDTAIMAATSLWGADVSGGYIALAHSASGKVDTSQVTGTVGMDFADVPLLNSLRVDATGDYVSDGMLSSDNRDLRASLAVAAPLADKVKASGTFGMGGSEQKKWMVKGEVALDDLWETGTVATIRGSKVGSEFITPAFAGAEWDFAGFDSFDRALAAGTVNLGGELVQDVSDDIKLVGKGDLRLNSDYKYEAPNGRLTAQGGISYSIAPNTTLDAMYRIFQDKVTNDTSDVAAVGLLYEF